MRTYATPGASASPELLLQRGIARCKSPDRVDVYEQSPLSRLGKTDKNELISNVQRRAEESDC